MSKVILTCGKICCGKTTYAQKLCKENNAILLSVDEITLALFGRDAGENHDTYVERTEKYLFEKSIEIIKLGINIVLDWGFWTKTERDFAKDFYRLHKIDYEIHYIEISDEIWNARLKKRNSAILAEETSAYYVDDGLAQKCASIFEVPNDDEIDVVYQGDINENAI